MSGEGPGPSVCRPLPEAPHPGVPEKSRCGSSSVHGCYTETLPHPQAHGASACLAASRVYYETCPISSGMSSPPSCVGGLAPGTAWWQGFLPLLGVCHDQGSCWMRTIPVLCRRSVASSHVILRVVLGDTGCFLPESISLPQFWHLARPCLCCLHRMFSRYQIVSEHHSLSPQCPWTALGTSRGDTQQQSQIHATDEGGLGPSCAGLLNPDAIPANSPNSSISCL